VHNKARLAGTQQSLTDRHSGIARWAMKSGQRQESLDDQHPAGFAAGIIGPWRDTAFPGCATAQSSMLLPDGKPPASY